MVLTLMQDIARPGLAHAAVTRPDGRTHLQSVEMTGCGDDTGWLRVEASGICGTDVSVASSGVERPTILGHHVVGRVDQLGRTAARRWNLAVGDRVVVEEYLPCWACRWCRSGRYRLCPATDLWTGGRRIGLVSLEETPALWGGNAQYMHLPPNAVVHPVPAGVPASLAVWTLPLANAIDWVCRVGGVAPGENVVVLGPGYHGLAALTVAQEAGSERVLIGGLGGSGRDGSRMLLAEKLGAAVFDTSDGDMAERVRDLTEGAMADLVVDTTGSGPQLVEAAMSLLAPTGRLVIAGMKEPPTARLDTAALVRGMHAVFGVRGRDPASVRAALQLLRRGPGRLADVPTSEVPLAGVGEMLGRLADGRGPDTPHVVVRPWLDGTAHATEGTDT